MLLVGLALALAGEPPGAELVFGGDVALGRVGRDGILAIGGARPLEGVAAVLSAADLAVVNLECALAQAPGVKAAIRLVAPPGAAATLAGAGVDLVSLANNHALDGGVPGLAMSVRALGAAGVTAVGLGEGMALERAGGLAIAFVAASDRRNRDTPGAWLRHIAFVPSAALLRVVRRRVEDAASADAIVVLLHWGAEHVPAPSRSQRELAHALVDAGARVVVGHGSHIVQEVERYRDGVIFYSLGNLLFDLDDPRTRQGALARVRLGARGELVGYELIPTLAGADDRPYLRR